MGKRLSKYEILEEIGRGGMGLVYKALDTRTNTTVAIKALPPELTHSPSLLRRFQQEAQALSSLHHPNIVRLIETFEENNTHFIVMEYVEGQTLSHILQKGPLPTEKAKAIALQICAALSHAHQQGIIHRDIKPSNIMITPDEKVKVTDFGIARVIDSTLGTITGTTMGTAEYMSPEQVRGEKADACSDIYSLGVVLYQMLTGRVPFTSDNRFAIGYMHLHQEPVPPRKVNPKVPGGLQEIVLHALEKRKEQRYQRVSDLAGDLQRGFLSPEARARAKAVLKPEAEAIAKRKIEVRPGPPSKRELRRLFLPVMAIAGLMLVLVVLVVRARPIVPSGSTTPAPAQVGISSTPPAMPQAVEQPPTTTPLVPEETSPVLGDKIAYIGTDNNIWVMNVNGSETRQVTQDATEEHDTQGALLHFIRYANPSWSPNGRRLAFDCEEYWRGESKSHWAVLVTDEGLKNPLKLVDDACSPTWAPDSHTIAYRKCPVCCWWGPEGHSSPDADGIWQVDVTTGGTRLLVGSQSGYSLVEPVWSPNGRYIAFHEASYEGYGPFAVADLQTGLQFPMHTSVGGFDWSPDGIQLVFDDVTFLEEEGEIWIANADGSGYYSLMYEPGKPWMSPLWSPDGKTIALTLSGLRFLPSDQEENVGIWIVDSEGTDRRQLTTFEGWPSSWSPDAQKLLVSGSDGYIYSVNVDGSGVRKIAEGISPTWQPMPSSAIAGQVEPTATSAQPQGSVDFDYGIAVTPYSVDLSRLVSEVQGLGFPWAQLDVSWRWIEPKRGQRNWNVYGLEDAVNAFHTAGIKILLNVAHAPDWARSGKLEEGPPDDFNFYGDFVAALSQHFKGKVQAIEVMEETNLQQNWHTGRPLSAVEYVDLLCQAYQSIKAVDPSIIVVSGAPFPTSQNDGLRAIDDLVYLEQMYEAGLRGCSDAVGAHPFGYNNPPDVDWQTYTDPTATFYAKGHRSWFFQATIEAYRDVMIRYSDYQKRLWATKFGWASIENVSPSAGDGYAANNSEAEQAEFLVKAFQFGHTLGYIGPMFVWNLNLAVVNRPAYVVSAYSIVRPNWSHRPAYDALATIPK